MATMDLSEPQRQGPQSWEVSADDAPLVRSRTMELLLSAGYFPSITHMFVVVIVGYVMLPVNSLWALIPWSLAFLGVLSAQMWMTRNFGDRRLSVAEARWVNPRFNLSQFGIGLLWGICGGLFFPADDFGRALFLVFVMGGMAMSAVATQHANLRFCIIQITLGLGPLAFNYTISDLPFGQLSGFFLFLYLAVLSSLAFRQYRFARKTIDLQIGQDRLLDQLSTQAEELRNARIRADEANDSKSRFLAQASHDLRQPLHAISLFVESMPSLKDNQQRETVLGKIRQSLDILTKLFDSLLDVTMLDTGGIEVEPVTFHLQDILDQVASDFEMIADASHVSIRVVPTSAIVVSDPVLVRRLVQNLLSNSLRHAPGHTALIGSRWRGDTISIVIADDGPGIAPEDQRRIFQEFERLEAARMGEGATPGLGLGLSIVQRIAKELGLAIELQSTPGKGTYFEISGLERGQKESILRQTPARAKSNILDGLLVYVLDDNQETLEATRLLLERWGCIVSLAQTPAELDEAPPDLFICDFEIDPNTNGLDVIDNMDLHWGQNTPTIMISAHSGEALKREITARGLPFLNKPVRPAPLRSAMLHAVSDSGDTS